MIRAMAPGDMDAVLKLWLSASLAAHDFIEPAFWRAQVEQMRLHYLPASEVHVHMDEATHTISGFYALHDNRLAAIFVAPERQNQGIGTQLLDHAKTRSAVLSLTVYQTNARSVAFYLARGFAITGEDIDVMTGQAEYLMSTGTRADASA